jgi:uncharacterized short protein YbdD (DUF466 family)
MSVGGIWRRLVAASEPLRVAWRYWSGNQDYERYVQQCAAAGLAPLDRGRYFAQRLEEQYRTTSRCC